MSRESLSFSGIFNDKVTYNGYKEAITEDGKTIDVCLVTIENSNGEPIDCNAYIDRDTKTVKRIVKNIDANNKYDYSMILEEATEEDVQEPEWTKECVEADQNDV